MSLYERLGGVCPSRVPVYGVLFMYFPAGALTWTKGRLFAVACIGTILFAFLYLCRVNPEVIVARSRFHKGTKRWDKILLAFLFLAIAATIEVATLDDTRFDWFPMPWWVCGIGYFLTLFGIAIVTWAESVNKFFEVTVRIQADRGQRVIDTGPYAVVRHPGYFAGLLIFLGMPLALGSVWALIPASLSCLLLVLRTHWEDDMLQAELPGYKDYAERIRHKLIRGVW